MNGSLWTRQLKVNKKNCCQVAVVLFFSVGERKREADKNGDRITTFHFLQTSPSSPSLMERAIESLFDWGGGHQSVQLPSYSIFFLGVPSPSLSVQWKWISSAILRPTTPWTPAANLNGFSISISFSRRRRAWFRFSHRGVIRSPPPLRPHPVTRRIRFPRRNFFSEEFPRISIRNGAAAR